MTAIENTSMIVPISLTIRIARREDIPKLEWYGQYAHYRHLFRRAYREQMLGRRLILIADSNNFPIGHIFIQFMNDNNPPDEVKRAYLYSLRVMETFRGYGIGTRLIQEAEGVIQDHGFAYSTIAVAKKNVRARQLYERLGYTIYAEDPGYWSYFDHLGHTRQVHEPCWLLRKSVEMR